jgi:plastocyanin
MMAVVATGVGALALLMGACGDDDSATPTPTRAAASAAATSPATTGSQAAATATVQIADNSFTPGTLTIARGGTVTWNWGGSNPHGVAGGDFKSDVKTGSGTFSFKFDRAGTFDYQCSVHGAAMPGKIVVQ